MSAGPGPGHGGEPQPGAGQSQQDAGQEQTGGAPSAAPPGWYPDPQTAGRQRWWDGSRWTEHVHPPQGTTPPHAGAPYTTDPAWLAARADQDRRQWAMFAHLSALIALFTGLNWLGPLVIYLVKRNDDPFVAQEAREALNFNISVFIYMAVTVVLIVIFSIILIGLLFIPVAIGIGIAWLVFVILAAVRANSGQPYRYPLTIRMVT